MTNPTKENNNMTTDAPIDLDATTIETLPEVVAEMLARAYKDQDIEPPIPEATS